MVPLVLFASASALLLRCVVGVVGVVVGVVGLVRGCWHCCCVGWVVSLVLFVCVLVMLCSVVGALFVCFVLLLLSLLLARVVIKGGVVVVCLLLFSASFGSSPLPLLMASL